MDAIRFKSDAARRKRLMVSGAMRHPAKMHMGILDEVVARYGIKPGDWVLDPMAGIGTTAVLALYGINVCLVELEDHFCRPMKASWEKMRQNPMLGYELSKVLILRGDARALPIGSADAVVTSPPWEGTDAQVSADKFRDSESFAAESARRYKDGSRRGHAASAEAILRSMKRIRKGYTRPDVIVTSPPYEGSIQGEPGIDWTKGEGGRRDFTKEPGYATRLASHSGYTAPRPDAIVTSPPFGEALSGGGIAQRGHYNNPGLAQRVYSPENMMSDSVGNIGNERGQKYWDSMFRVYQECCRVLRPGGLLVLVLKGFTRDGEYVDLPTLTSELVQSLGFVSLDHWRRELWSLSFWRILQKRRTPDTFDDRLNYEEIIAFRKEHIPNGG